jgi:hypothetical protein
LRPLGHQDSPCHQLLVHRKFGHQPVDVKGVRVELTDVTLRL